MNAVVKDVTDADFKTAVLERSREKPVVVDLWAPWCGPCRQIAPVLERLAEERAEDFELVKINVDENPQTATALGARSIPLVIGFKDGEVASQFVGVQPPAAISQFIDDLSPSEIDRLIAAASAESDNDAAKTLLQQAINLDPEHAGTRIAIAKLLMSEGNLDDAREVISKLVANGDEAATQLMTRMSLQDAGAIDLATLQATAEAEPDNLDNLILLGRALASSQDYEPALDQLLAAVGKNPGYNDGEARKAIVDILKVLGNEHSLTRVTRTRLARLIF